MAGPVGPVQQTGQTGASVVSPVTSTPNMSTPCSANPSRTNELTNCVQTFPSQKSGSPHEPIFDNVHANSLGCAPMNSIQMMEHDDRPIAHRLNSASQASTTGRCEADLAKLKEDLAGHNEAILLDLSSVRQGRNESVLDYL